MIHAVVAIALVLAQQPARAAPPCVSRAEAADMVLFMLPTFVDRVGDRCRNSLPQTSFLTSNGRAFAERVRREGGDRWPSARNVLKRIAGDRIPPFLGDETLRRMSLEAIGAKIIEDVKTKDCEAIDEAFGLLAPLPVDNIGRLGALFVAEGGSRKDNSSGVAFTVCPSPSA